MDRARQYTTVKDYERRNPQEVEYHDMLFDHQMMLNETRRPAEVREVALGLSPKNGASRTSARPWAAAEDDNEAAKAVTETWEEYAVRVQEREAHLTRYFAEQAAADRADEIRKQERAKVSSAAVERLAAYQKDHDAKAYRPCLHTLRTNFDEITEVKMSGERASLEAEHDISRNEFIKSEEAPARREIEIEAGKSLDAVLAILEQQRLRRLAEEQRRIDEQKAREAAKKAEEERRRAEEASVELARRQAEAEAKQAEQRRRAEERKAKARAERERTRANRSSIAGGATVSSLGGGGGADTMLDMTLAGQTLATLDTTELLAATTSNANNNTITNNSERNTPRGGGGSSATPAEHSSANAGDTGAPTVPENAVLRAA